MQSDPWWSFAMAVNVFMVFFFAANPTTFRRYLWVYCVICYGRPPWCPPSCVSASATTPRAPYTGTPR